MISIDFSSGCKILRSLPVKSRRQATIIVDLLIGDDGQTDANSHIVNSQSIHSDVQSLSNREILVSSVKLRALWFTYLAYCIRNKAQFASKSVIQDTTKDEYVLIAFVQEAISSVIDFIRDPLATNKHLKLKKTLMRRNALSESSKLDKCLSDTGMEREIGLVPESPHS